MLKKLFVYDFRDIGKTMWLFTLIVVLTTLGGCGAATALWSFDWEGSFEPNIATVSLVILLAIVIFISYVAVIAYMVLSTIMIMKRYYTNLFTDEGYLTFTLPVSTDYILNAKILAGVLWNAITMVVTVGAFAAIIVCVISPEHVGDVVDIYADMFSVFFGGGELSGGNLVFYCIEYIVYILIALFFGILLMYVAITVASVIAKKARVILGIGIYAGATAVISTVTSVGSVIISVVSAEMTEGLEEYSSAMNYLSVQAHIQMIFMIVIYGVVSVGAYLLNRYLLKNKLNLL